MRNSRSHRQQLADRAREGNERPQPASRCVAQFVPSRPTLGLLRRSGTHTISLHSGDARSDTKGRRQRCRRSSPSTPVEAWARPDPPLKVPIPLVVLVHQTLPLMIQPRYRPSRPDRGPHWYEACCAAQSLSQVILARRCSSVPHAMVEATAVHAASSAAGGASCRGVKLRAQGERGRADFNGAH
jgi:hypothetical protein